MGERDSRKGVGPRNSLHGHSVPEPLLCAGSLLCAGPLAGMSSSDGLDGQENVEHCMLAWWMPRTYWSAEGTGHREGHRERPRPDRGEAGRRQLLGGLAGRGGRA